MASLEFQFKKQKAHATVKIYSSWNNETRLWHFSEIWRQFEACDISPGK